MKNSSKLTVLTVAIVSAITFGAKAQNIPTTGNTPAGSTITTGSGIRLSVGPDAGLPLGK
jgi:hypothetical protein